MDNSENGYRGESRASLEKYLLMDDKEKDREIQKAVDRLQKRIQEILFLLDTTGSQHERKEE